MPHRHRIAIALACAVTLAAPAVAQDMADNPLLACDRAAAHAEADWHLPDGLLSAIGIVESGRGDLGTGRPVPWPWSINTDGRGYVMLGKAEAIAAVRAFQDVGRRAIDVGCFQVDLFYHPDAFASLEAALDPEANAQAAARILMLSRLRGNSWDMAIALYHSASPLLGAQYLRQVQAVWSWTRTRGLGAQAAYAVLLSPAARQIQVISAMNPPVPSSGGLPRVLGPQGETNPLQWTAMPQAALPIVLTPRVDGWHGGRGMQAVSQRRAG